MAVITVVIGIGALGLRVVETLRAQQRLGDSKDRVLLAIGMAGSEAATLNPSDVQLSLSTSKTMARKLSVRSEERAAFLSDYQRGQDSRLYKLWREVERKIDGNDATISLVVEAGAAGSGLVLDIAHAARAFVAKNQPRFVRGYIVMPSASEKDKAARAYATFSEIHRYQASTPLHAHSQ